MTKEEIIKYAEDMISKNEYALIGSTSKEKYPNIRALKVMKRESINTFYFSTKETTVKVDQIRRNNKGCIFFYDTKNYASVMIEGTYKVTDNTLFDVSSFFFLDPDPYNFCNIIFNAETLYLYVPYQKHRIDL